MRSCVLWEWLMFGYVFFFSVQNFRDIPDDDTCEIMANHESRKQTTPVHGAHAKTLGAGVEAIGIQSDGQVILIVTTRESDSGTLCHSKYRKKSTFAVAAKHASICSPTQWIWNRSRYRDRFGH